MSLASQLASLATRIATEVKGKMAKVTSLPAASGVAGSITIVDDGSSTATWPNRWSVWFDPQSGSDVEVFALNEYGEPRVMPAKANTTAFRIFSALTSAGYTARDKSVPLFEVADDRTTRTTKYAVYPDGDVYVGKDIEIVGKLTAPNHPPILALEDGATIPGGTTSTLVVFYDPDPL